MLQRFSGCLISILILPLLSQAAALDDVDVSVGIGGLERVVQGQWGMVRGTFRNESEHDKELLVVVIPAFSQGLQFSRRVVVPARTYRECEWPVLIPERDTKSFDFEYLVFDNPDGSGPIKRVAGEHVTRTFHVVNPKSRTQSMVRYRGLLTSGERTRDLHYVREVADTLRAEAGFERMGIEFQAKHIDGYPESLECLQQLLITSATLHEFPAACDAVRIWTQRGGRTWLFVEQTGLDPVRALLGDAFPVTKIDETSSNEMRFEISRSVPVGRSREREVDREFEEPVRLVRLIAPKGKVLWTVDGWPAVIELPFGDGTVIVTTVSPEVFLQYEGGTRTLANARQIAEGLFLESSVRPSISEDQLGAAAAGFIGYAVPSRLFAASVMLGFAVLLVGFCIVLQRRDQIVGLLWGIPALAFLFATPAVWVGSRTRNVAPETAVQQQLIFSVDGQTTLAADGLASVYQPAPGAVNVKMTDFALLSARDAKTDSNQRRMIWTDRGESEWQNLSQQAGLRDYRIRALRRFDRPGGVRATLDENGLVGSIDPDVNPADIILAGASRERLAVRVGPEGKFHATPDDVLAVSEYVAGTFLTDVQKQHAAVYESLFRREQNRGPFPDELSMLYFTQLKNPAITIGGEGTRQERSLLLIQRLLLQPPPPNTTFTIPTVLLPYRSVLDPVGGMSGAYNNRERRWMPQQRASITYVEVSLPDICQPFTASGGSISMRINAGARQVSVSIGQRDAPVLVRRLDSPAGLFTVEMPAEHLNTVVASGKLYVAVEISEPDLGTSEYVEDGARQDTWQIGRMMLTLEGMRTP